MRHTTGFGPRLCALFVGLVSFWLAWMTPLATAQVDDEEFEREPSPELPETSAIRQIKWVIDVMNGDAEIGDLEEHFSDRFLEDFKEGELAAELKSIRREAFKGNRVIISGVEQAEADHTASIIIQGESTSRYLSMFVVVDDKHGKIASLIFAQAVGATPGSVDWDAFEGEVGERIGKASFAAYEILPTATTTEPPRARLRIVHGFNEHLTRPVGMASRLWTIGALSKEIAAGRQSWLDTLPIDPSLQCKDMSILSSLPPGSHVQLQHLAGLTLDGNRTACDHLFRDVTRARVEAFMSEFTKAPSRNLPLLSPRDESAIRFSGFLQQNFLEASASERASMLAPGGMVSRRSALSSNVFLRKQPMLVDELGWFASAAELCRAFAEIDRLASEDGMQPLKKMMGERSNRTMDRVTWNSWSEVSASEPGIAVYCSTLEREDGRRFVMTIAWSHPTQVLDINRVSELADKGAEILAGFDVDAKPKP